MSKVRQELSNRSSVLVLFGFLVLCALAASTGIIFTPGPWYAGLEKPDLTPPNWLFPPVWTALYIMMAVAAWLVWKRAGSKQAHLAMLAFLVQLALNAAWSWLFFGMHLTAWALVELSLLWLTIIATLVLFARIHVVSGWLLAPYLLWVSFAGYLNFGLWQLNR